MLTAFRLYRIALKTFKALFGAMRFFIFLFHYFL